MVASELGVLVGLALADSTSIGTLVIPIWLLMRERLEVGRILLYLVVIAGFYWVLSLALLAFVTQVTEFAHTLQPDRSWSWIQLAAGVIVLGLGIWTDRRPGPSTAQPSRAGRWRSRTLRLDGNRAIIGLALTAGVLEAATMLPLLAAVGMIERSTFSPIESALAVSGYVAIMMLPAIALLAVRVGIGERAAQPLAAAGRWLERQSNAVIATILIVLGGLVAADAAIRLDLVS
ncbi:GAP family protein [Microbacterium sp. 22303]|uniref:GAP family protein n=1 Tax=Microbacterium sp. 22303 TaxID=3453905 RepID=UPI003F849F62